MKSVVSQEARVWPEWGLWTQGPPHPLPSG